MHTKNTIFFPKLGLLLILFVFVIQSCAPKPPDIVDVDPTLTLDALDPVICDEVTPIAQPTVKKPKVVYILIDRSGSYGRYTKRAMDVLIEGLKLSIDPGDRLYLIWLGASHDPNNRKLPQNPTLPDKYLLVETVPPIEHLQLTPPIPTFTPTATSEPTPTPTSFPTPYATLGVLEAQAKTATAEAINAQLTVTADALNIIATNRAIFLENDINQQKCDQATINQKNLIEISNWEDRKKQIIDDFISQKLDPLRELYPQANDPSTHLYNSLYYAARTIRDEKDTGLFRSYHLIILSDMEDAGSKEGEKLQIDMSDVKILMAMVYCAQSIDCQNKERYWTQYFKDREAKLSENSFKLLEETTPYLISNFLHKNGVSK